jgi:hypothetical protein
VRDRASVCCRSVFEVVDQLDTLSVLEVNPGTEEIVEVRVP